MRHKTIYTVFMALLMFSNFSIPCIADDSDEEMMIDSGEAGYNGKKIVLSGKVIIEHDLGKLEADQMELTPEVNNKRIRAKYLTMENHVKIGLKDGGELNCSKADVDFQAFHGTFCGDDEQSFVTYTELCPDKSGCKVPVVVKSRQMGVQIAREKDLHTTKSVLSDITAENEVTVNYNNDFMAASDHAAYHRFATKENDNALTLNKHLPGLISLRANGNTGVCQITNRNGDMITADHFCIDTAQRQLFFAYPKGALYISKEGPNRERVDFSGDTLTWEDAKNTLILREHVSIHQKGMGKLISDKDVKLTQESVGGKKRLCTIESTGTTILSYVEDEKDISHNLTSYGSVCVDHKNLVTIMESPYDAKGNVPAGKQVAFQDYMGEIYADRLVINYVMENHALKPVKLTLEGHVRMLNRCAVDPECKGDFLQFALADFVEYSPQAKEIMLAAKNKNRVLFFDKVNNLQVSAPALKIRRDEATKKESVQGVGNVRFTFIKQEMDAIAKQFNLESKSPEKTPVNTFD